MYVMEFLSCSVMLKTSSALFVFSNFARLLLLCKQSSVKPTNRKKKIVASFIQLQKEKFIMKEQCK